LDLKDDACINPCKGLNGGVTWEQRFEDLEKNLIKKLVY